MKIRYVLSLFGLFLVINLSVYFFTQKNVNERVKWALDESIKSLNTNYEIIKYYQELTAKTMYDSTILDDRVLEIIKEAIEADDKKKDKLRGELYDILKPRYEREIQKGVFQYHIVFPNNVSFLRMHKHNRFGDDLSDVRDDYVYVNRYKRAISVFVQGRVTHGFRNTFPLFSKDGEHIGAMEVSFSSENLQWVLNNIGHIHSHFLLNKKVFESKKWDRDDVVLNYKQSAEHKDFLISFTSSAHSDEVCINRNAKRLEPIRGELDANIALEKPFALYTMHKGDIDVMSYIPIRDMSDNVAAWLVAYTKNRFMEKTFSNVVVFRVVIFVFSVVLIYFIALQLLSKNRVEVLLKITEQKASTDALTGIYNRHKFNEIFKLQMQMARRYKHPLSIAILDIDHFKKVNDTYGHLVGDEVLVNISKHISKNIRKTDTFARWGGEEFVILFEETSLQDAKDISLKLKDALHSLNHGVAGSVSMSFGVTQLRDDDTLDSVFNRCDEALYIAKENGRDRVEVL